MEWGDAIRELWRRSGIKTKEQYAAMVGTSRSHTLNVLNGKEPGSYAMLVRHLAFAKIRPEDCFSLPSPGQKPVDSEQQAIEQIDRALDLLKRRLTSKKRGKTGTHASPG